MYYQAFKDKIFKDQFLLPSYLSVRCVEYRRGCKFRANMVITHCKDSSKPDFFDPQNFRLSKPGGKLNAHTCLGSWEPFSVLSNMEATNLFSNSFKAREGMGGRFLEGPVVVSHENSHSVTPGNLPALPF